MDAGLRRADLCHTAIASRRTPQDSRVFYQLIFGGIGERIELIHRAHSRDSFAKGALRAAKWAGKEKPGLYNMRDVLGL